MSGVLQQLGVRRIQVHGRDSTPQSPGVCARGHCSAGPWPRLPPTPPAVTQWASLQGRK